MSSCYKCAEKYSFFKKEIGCSNCGFGFCSKCCSNKISVPKKNNKVLNVCTDCYKKIKDDSTPKEDKSSSPPANFLKLVEENKNKPLTTNKDSKLVQVKNNDKNFKPDPDQQLAERLAKLNDSDKKPKLIPTDQEIEERLRKLKGISEEANSKSNIPSEDKIITSDDLIHKINDEIRIEKKYSDPNTTDDIVNKMLEDEEKRQKKAKNNVKNHVQDSDDEEKWCCICNDDAVLICFDCENDMYCNKCFKHSHRNSEYRQHKIKQLR